MKKDEAQWDLAGVTLHGQLPAASLPVPAHLALNGDWLTSERLQPGGGRTEPSPDVLLRFARIHTPDDVLRFAKRFGVLRSRERRRGRYCREPLDEWLVRAREVRAILNVASALHRGDVPSLDDWRAVYERADPTHLPWLSENRPLPPDAARFFLSMLINEWLKWADARPMFEWLTEEPRVAFGRNLPALLATGLMLAVTRTEGLTICSACGDPYLRTGRQAKRGQQNYCPACGPKAGWRHAAQRQNRDGRRRPAKRRVAVGHLNAADRASNVLALATELGPPPSGTGAGDYWRRFHARARALKLVNGRRPVASRMAYLRARRRRAG
jgi:hypothetical protein